MKFVTISGSNQSSSRPPDAGHRGSAYKALVPPEPSYLVGRYGEIENEIDDLDNLCARKQRRRRWTVFTRPTPIFPKSGQSLDSLSSRSREKLPAPSTDATTFPPTRARGSLHAAPCMRLLLFASGMASVSALHDRDREGCGDHDQDHRRDAFNRVSKRALRSGRGTVACSALAVRWLCVCLALALRLPAPCLPSATLAFRWSVASWARLTSSAASCCAGRATSRDGETWLIFRLRSLKCFPWSRMDLRTGCHFLLVLTCIVSGYIFAISFPS